MSAIAIIPARGGSRRIKRKNIRPFHGKPIIAYSIETAKASGLFDRIIVSTDDREIYDISEQYGADGYIRPFAYGRDEVGTQEVAKECLDFYQYSGEYACVIYATSPLMSASDLIRGWNCLGIEGAFIISVGYPPLHDAAQFYWGTAHDFRVATPLINEGTTLIHIAPERVCDINTSEDWEDALRMYTKLEKLESA